MQVVSQAWKRNQQQKIVDEGFLEIRLTLADPEALLDASISDNGSAWISNTPQVIDGLEKNMIPYASLENNLWLLNGTIKISDTPPDGDTGYVGDNLCNEDCSFDTFPLITIEYSSIHDKPLAGISIKWGEAYNEFSTDFRITAYNGMDIVAERAVTGNEDVSSVIEINIANYDRIEIEILKWSIPFRRVRTAKILTGIEKIYSKRDALAFSQTMNADPISASLPKYSIRYTTDNTDGIYDFNNASGLSTYLIERQEIIARCGYKFGGEIEWIKLGKFYLSEWTVPQDGVAITFSARDMLEYLTDLYTKGCYRPEGISLYDLAVEVLTDVDLPLDADGNVNWVINEVLKGIYTTAALPVIPHAECLQHIANAGGCAMYFDRDGKLYIDPTSIVLSFAGYATATDNGAAWISNTNQIVDAQEKNIVPYASTEANAWILNGTKFIAPLSEHGDTGYIGSLLSDETGTFQNPAPVVRLEFSRLHTNLLQQFIITWNRVDGEYATDFTITAYNNAGALVAQEHVTGNQDITSTTAVNFQNYSAIEVEIHGWSLPSRLPRIENIPVHPDYVISRFNSFQNSEITVNKLLRDIRTSAYTYLVEQEATEIYSATIPITGTQTVVCAYSQAATNVTASVTGGTLIASKFYTYTCELEIQASSDVAISISGFPVKSSETVIVVPNAEDGDSQTVQNPLITSVSRARAVSEWIKEYISFRNTIASNWRADPRLDVLDVVMNQNRYDMQPVRMTKVRYEYNGAWLGSGEGRVLNA